MGRWRGGAQILLVVVVRADKHRDSGEFGLRYYA